jgi:hypothetical protein
LRFANAKQASKNVRKRPPFNLFQFIEKYIFYKHGHRQLLFPFKTFNFWYQPTHFKTNNVLNSSLTRWTGFYALLKKLVFFTERCANDSVQATDLRLVAVIRAPFRATTRHWDLWCTRPLESTFVVDAPVAPFNLHRPKASDSKSILETHYEYRSWTTQLRVVRLYLIAIFYWPLSFTVLALMLIGIRLI